MQAINRLDILLIAMVVIFGLNIIAIIYMETEGAFITAVGGIVTLVGYAFIRPQIVSECNFKEG